MVEKTTFAIEAATWRDLTALRQLEKEAFGDDAWPLLDLIAVLTMPGVVRLKAVIEEEMAGFIGGDRREEQQVGWITTLAVANRYRRQGIAKALLEICERQLETPVVRLSVRRSNTGALKLYENLGYQPYTVWSAYYPGGEDALVLEKRLTLSSSHTMI